MTKSIVNAMTGILSKQGKLNIHAPAPIPEWQQDERRNITIADLLHMSSGLKWWEYYFAPSNATNMLFKEKNMGPFAASLPLKSRPGTVFNYSSGTTNLLSYIIRQTLGDNAYYRFPYEQLFYKIGMNSAVIETDAGGTFIGSSYGYATPRDWARFGLLYLNDGVWNGERILPQGWVKFTATPAPAKNAVGKDSYGAMWWLNAGPATGPNQRKLPDVPADCFSCEGFGGQYVWVIPSRKLVVVRLGLDEGDSLDPNKFLSMVIKALP
jgi:CubicO group peptidase (beta-lactamase class C family)